MRALAMVFVAALAFATAALAASSKDWSDCEGDNFDRAIAACSKIIAQGKETAIKSALAYSNRGRAYVEKADYDHAIADLDEALRIDPKPSTPYYNRALAHQNKNDDDAAIADLTKFIELQPSDPDGYKTRADSYANKGDTARAIADYDEAIKRKADDANAYYGRGVAYFVQNEFDRSLADCDRAITLKADYAEAYACRADAIAGRYDYDDAIAGFDKAIALTGKYAWGGLHRGRADSLSNKGEFAQAVAGYGEALKVDPKDAEAVKNCGITRCNSGDYADGIADLTEALQLDPKTAGINNARAWCMFKQGETDKALDEAERAVAATPEDAATLDTRGLIYLRKGLLDLAFADFDRALQSDATMIEVYRDRGLAYEQKGDRGRALADYGKALALKARWVLEHEAQAEALQHLTNLAAVSPSEDARHATSNSSPAPASEKRIALVIGNGAYDNVRALKNADGDARAVAASLRRLGFEVVEKHDLKLTQLIAELKAFGDRAPQFDWAVVYYAGHGIEIGGINYLIPVDAELSVASHVDDEAFPLNRVLAKVEGAQKLRLVILDACRENPFIAKMASAGGTRSVGRGLARIEPEGGVLVAYSAKDGQVAQDGDGDNSPFAQALLDHLDEAGLEINMLFRKVHDDVKKRTSGQQIPFTYGALPAEAMYFKAAGQ